MSLRRQIQVLIALIILTTMTSVLWITLRNSREFTANDLYFQAKNNANILALTLGGQSPDEPLMKTSINAMFDGGLFRSIRLRRQDGSVVYQQESVAHHQGVPFWFSELADLPSPAATASVSSGWMIYGTLEVTGHTGPAYLQLWQSFQDLLIAFTLVAVISFSVSIGILNYLMRSLVRIQRQAEAIGRNQFIITEELPATPDLKNVTLAMNDMVRKIQATHEQQLASIKQYQDLYFRDELSGLHNRKYLVKQLNYFLRAGDARSHGEIIIFSLVDIGKINISLGHPIIKGLLQDLAQVIREGFKAIADTVICRLPKDEFAILLPICDAKTATKMSATIRVECQNVIDGVDDVCGVVSFCGGETSYTDHDTLGSILSRVDYGLSMAKSQMGNGVVRFQEEVGQQVLGKYEWKKIIESALIDKQLSICSQPVLGDGELHQAVYLEQLDDGKEGVATSVFMPMVNSLRLAIDMDQYVLRCALSVLQGDDTAILAVNVTADFCKDREAYSWLRSFLVEHKNLQERLFFEINETVLLTYPSICLDLAGLLRGLGFGLGLDHFSMDAGAINLFDKLHLAYLKVERDFLLGDEQQILSMDALNALVGVCERFDIILVATKIEDETQRSALSNYVSFFQGDGVARKVARGKLA